MIIKAPDDDGVDLLSLVNKATMHKQKQKNKLYL